MAAALEVEGLTRRYGTRTAVEDLTFAVDAGEVVGFVGPNGAGKTTTIRILSTMLRPTAGRFRVAGVPDADPTGIRRRIGVLPESAGYPGGRTGREYLRHVARLHGLLPAEAARRAADLLDEVGLADRADSPVATYSRGMRQRLGIARAVVNDPAVVLLDEPTLGLDPPGRRRMLDTVRDLAGRRGAAVLVSTHELDVVEEICSRVVVLDRGRVVRAGPVGAMGGPDDAPVVRVRVPADRADAATRVLSGTGLLVREAGPGLLVGTAPASPAGAVPAPGTMLDAVPDPGTAALRALLDAGVPVLAYDAGARLDDVFATLTGGGRS